MGQTFRKGTKNNKPKMKPYDRKDWRRQEESTNKGGIREERMSSRLSR